MDQFYRNYYGKNYDKAMEKAKIVRAGMREKFIKKCPNADLSKFIFEVDLNKDGSVNSTAIYFKNSDVLSTDITSDTFLNDKSMIKYLYSNKSEVIKFPKIWKIGGTVQELPKGKRHKDFTGKGYYWDNFPTEYILNYPVNNFRLYVNGRDYFMTALPKLNITIDKTGRPTEASRFDIKQPYFQSIIGACVASYA